MAQAHYDDLFHRKYRSRIKIMGEILNIVANNTGNNNYINGTRIMYKAMLSCSQLKDYLSVLVESRLLENNNSKDKSNYGITQNGMNFLRIYNDTDRFISV